MESTIKYINKNKKRFLNELKEFLTIPSISADPAYKGELKKAASFLADKMKGAGLDKVKIYPTKGHPIVYGQKIIDKKLPTVLVYGHYDVQPPDPLELWTSGPFKPVVKKTELHPDGAIFARGACDDKGQLYMHVKAFEAMMATDSLPL